ncbi:MAG: T9SS type A sorting domain-containing protein [Bacteroidota bacterium]
MKKILLLVSIFCASFAARAQNTILCENFNTYDSVTAVSGVFHGFTISYHSAFSYYTSTQSSGTSGPNSYKFGVDSATMISPDITGATYVQFWMKGNATNSASTFYIYDSPDGTSWTLIQAINPVNTIGMYRQYALNPGAAMIKFFYDKDTGNVAFDDFCTTDGPTFIGETVVSSIPSIFPNPSKGMVTLSALSTVYNNCKVTVMNVLGKEVKSFSFNDLNSSNKTLDLTALDKGVYLVRCKSEKSEFIQRLILRD